MYGYIRPRKSELKVREYELYRAAYCGLCHSLAKEFGPLARYTVSYDMTFLYMLMQRDEGYPELCLRRCPAHPLRRRCAACRMEGATLCAAATVLLFCHKLQDDMQDEGFARRFAAAALRLLFSGPFRRAKKRYPALSDTIRTQLAELSRLEREGCRSLDAVSHPFATVTASLREECGDPRRDRALAELLYHVGRVVYFTDAADDLPEDIRRGRFNPLSLRFGVKSREELLSHTEDFHRLCDASLAAAASAYLDLEKTAFSPIVENILLLGLPEAVENALQGRQQTTKEKKHE